MLKATVDNGTKQLWFEKKVPEARAVDGYIGPLNLLLACGGPTFGGSLGLLIFLIVQKFIINVSLCHLYEHNVNLCLKTVLNHRLC